MHRLSFLNPQKRRDISFASLGTPAIISEKLNDKNYFDWYIVDVWFLGHRLYDHLTKKVDQIDASVREEWQKADYQLVFLLWQSIDP